MTNTDFVISCTLIQANTLAYEKKDLAIVEVTRKNRVGMKKKKRDEANSISSYIETKQWISHAVWHKLKVHLAAQCRGFLTMWDDDRVRGCKVKIGRLKARCWPARCLKQFQGMLFFPQKCAYNYFV